jgi:Na+(H+)/acetate symporter ActP
VKTSTKFFIAATFINIVLSVIATFSTVLKEVRVVDLVTFYATAFGAGASFAAVIISMMKKKPEEASALNR